MVIASSCVCPPLFPSRCALWIGSWSSIPDALGSNSAGSLSEALLDEVVLALAHRTSFELRGELHIILLNPIQTSPSFTYSSKMRQISNPPALGSANLIFTDASKSYLSNICLKSLDSRDCGSAQCVRVSAQWLYLHFSLLSPISPRNPCATVSPSASGAFHLP